MDPYKVHEVLLIFDFYDSFGVGEIVFEKSWKQIPYMAYITALQEE